MAHYLAKFDLRPQKVGQTKEQVSAFFVGADGLPATSRAYLVVKDRDGAAAAIMEEVAARWFGQPRLSALLQDYLAKFDDQALNDREMKEWLDREWIPAVRKALAS